MINKVLILFISLAITSECFALEVDSINEDEISLISAIENDIKGNRQDKIIKKLIEKGADVNKPSEFGFTPLMVASLGDNLYLIQTLINAGADVNAIAKKTDNPVNDIPDYYSKQKELQSFLDSYVSELSPLSIALEVNIDSSSGIIARMLYQNGAVVSKKEYTDICISRLNDIGNPHKKNPITDDEGVNRVLRAAEYSYDEYLKKCEILVDAGLIIKGNDEKYLFNIKYDN